MILDCRVYLYASPGPRGSPVCVCGVLELGCSVRAGGGGGPSRRPIDASIVARPVYMYSVLLYYL